MSFYQRIRDLREDADKTQSDIGSYLGTTAQYYGKYEKGEREIPLSRAIELADYYGVSLDYLAGRSNIINSDATTLLPEDERRLLEVYRNLTERNKGKAELFLEQLEKSQMEQTIEKKHCNYSVPSCFSRIRSNSPKICESIYRR